MRLLLVISFLIFNKVIIGQSCLNKIDSIFYSCDTTNFEKETIHLSDTCKESNWYSIYLAKSYFFKSEINQLETLTNKIIKTSYTKNSGDYIINSRVRFLCFLLIEEFRRTKNKPKFDNWLETFYKIKQDFKCSNPFNYRVDKTLYFMKLRFQRLNETKNLTYYKKIIKQNNRSNRIKRKFLKY